MDLFRIHRHRRTAAGSGRRVTQTTGLVMGYYDGNTVTALWNYAQHFAHERQLVWHHLWSVHAGRAQPDFRPDQRRDQHTERHRESQ